MLFQIFKLFNMNITTASSVNRVQPLANKFLWLLAALLLTYWIYGWFYCIDLQDWIIENLLVVICLFILFFQKSGTSLAILVISAYFFFLYYTFGAFYAYTQNALGAWLQNTFDFWRNPYDRIVTSAFHGLSFQRIIAQ